MMKIERIETAYFRLPLEPMGDAGHGAIDSEELISLKLQADGLTGHGYAYTIGRGGHRSHRCGAMGLARPGERKPLYALLGAQSRSIPAYGSGVDLPKSLEDLLAQTAGFLARGLPGVK